MRCQYHRTATVRSGRTTVPCFRQLVGQRNALPYHRTATVRNGQTTRPHVFASLWGSAMRCLHRTATVRKRTDDPSPCFRQLVGQRHALPYHRTATVRKRTDDPSPMFFASLWRAAPCAAVSPNRDRQEADRRPVPMFRQLVGSACAPYHRTATVRKRTDETKLRPVHKIPGQ